MQNLWTFIKSNYSRIAWEFAKAGASYLLGYGISYFTSRATLETCQDERTELLKQNAVNQAFTDSLKWSGRIALSESQKQALLHENLKLRERIALDSAARMSELETMRSINRRYSNSTR